MTLSARVIAAQCLTEAERDLWDGLQSAHPGLDAAFLSHPYVSAAAAVFPDVRICVLERAGQPVGFFPFQYRQSWQRLLGWGERIGGELSDHFGVILPSGIRVSPGRLLGLAGLTSLAFTHLAQSQRERGLTGERPERGLLIRFPAGGDAYWQELRQRDKRFAADTERRERKLIDAKGPLRFVFRQTDPLSHLRHLVAAKRAQYGRTGVGDPLADDLSVRFLETLAGLDHPSCRGVLSTLVAGETWVASHFGLMHGGTLHYWFPVYNPELQAFSPGRLLVKAIILSSAESGVRVIDRGAGDTVAKRDFANAEQWFTRGHWHLPTVRGLACRLGLAAKWRIERRQAASAGAGELGERGPAAPS